VEQKEEKKPVFNVNWKPLTDESEMPGEGAHKGKKMKDVPADYLVWCFDNGRCSKSVVAYVVDHLDELRKKAAAMNPKGYKREPWEGGRIDFASSARKSRWRK
jgi:hypothetical protein